MTNYPLSASSFANIIVAVMYFSLYARWVFLLLLLNLAPILHVALHSTHKEDLRKISTIIITHKSPKGIPKPNIKRDGNNWKSNNRLSKHTGWPSYRGRYRVKTNPEGTFENMDLNIPKSEQQWNPIFELFERTTDYKTNRIFDSVVLSGCLG
uniref:Uncharacterized protein n=1 Tax=Cacopsylla melanoneura TaxID=428564 RepID=A0A8D8YG61_9HEMI